MRKLIVFALAMAALAYGAAVLVRQLGSALTADVQFHARNLDRQ